MATPSTRRALQPWQAVLLWALIAFLWWLDQRFPVPGPRHEAHIFGWLIYALSAVATASEVVIAGIEASIELAVVWLASAVGWISSRLIDLFISTGAVFAKVWDALTGLWERVVVPVIREIDSWYERFRGWLARVVAPLVEWAQRVRDELTLIYRRFVRPILDVIDTTRRVLDILAKLHVPFAAQLDQYLTEAEQWFASEWLRLTGYVNRILDTLDGLLTFDGLLQRFVFIRTLERDAFFVWNVLRNAHTRQLTDAERYKIARATEYPDVKTATDDTAAWLKGDAATYADTLDAAVDTWVEMFGQPDEITA
jgi:hypothetical protein